MKSIYFAKFYSNVNYANIIWGQNLNSAFTIVTLKKKTISIINNQLRNSHSSQLFKKGSILKFEDKILIKNIIFISKSINNLLPPIFKNWFIFYSEIHNYDLSLHIELTPMEKKTLLLWVLLIARIKHETFWGICQLNRSTQIKLKLFSLKDALTNTNNGP